MDQQIERRSLDDELSPDILAMLESCGERIREGDRQQFARRRSATPGAPLRRRASDDPKREDAAGWLADLPGGGS